MPFLRASFAESCKISQRWLHGSKCQYSNRNAGPARKIKLPKGVSDRLQKLLDQQDRGERLTAAEKREADELAEMLSLMRLRSERAARNL
ncbi:MAG: hypothetical protein ABIU09_07030 [Pyrinomonadaceae bacterium]